VKNDDINKLILNKENHIHSWHMNEYDLEDKVFLDG